MEYEDPPSSVFSLTDAVERIGDAKLVETWIDARARYIRKRKKWPSGIPIPDSWDTYFYQIPSSQRDARVSSSTLESAWKSLTEHVLDQLSENRLVAWGREGTPTARYVLIPVDAWSVLIPDWQNNLAKTSASYTYFNIKVFPAVFVDPNWDKGLRLLDACEFIDPEMAQDLIDPWAPEIEDGERDQDWDEGSRDYARDQLWRVIHGWQKKGVITFFVQKPDNSQWHHILEVGPIPSESESERVDFLASEISIKGVSNPLECCLVRGREFPENYQPSPKYFSGTSSNKARFECESWLREKSFDGQSKIQSKLLYWKQAKRKFHRLSRRSFDGAWDNAVPDSWKESGRPLSSS